MPACPDDKLEMRDFLHDGLRPVLKASGCSKAVSACPRVRASRWHILLLKVQRRPIESLARRWGPILEVWEGHAIDPSVHYEGSSGGVATGMALYCIENAGMCGVAHVGNDPAVVYRNKSVFSRTRSDVLRGIGSRYSPASPATTCKRSRVQMGPRFSLANRATSRVSARLRHSAA